MYINAFTALFACFFFWGGGVDMERALTEDTMYGRHISRRGTEAGFSFFELVIGDSAACENI